MTKSNNTIVTELINAGWLESTIRNNCRDNPFHEDLFQEISLIILEMDNLKLNDLDYKGDLKRYIVGMIKKQGNSNNSPFHYKYRKTVAISDSMDNDPYRFESVGQVFNTAFIEDEDFNDTKEQIDYIISNNLSDVDRKVFLLFIQGLTYKQIVDCGGVTMGSAHRSVKRSQMIIKNKLKMNS